MKDRKEGPAKKRFTMVGSSENVLREYCAFDILQCFLQDNLLSDQPLFKIIQTFTYQQN